MKEILHTVQEKLMRTLDLAFARWPQPTPPPGVLENCKIICHRGEHDNRTVLENTLPAFDQALEGGVWGAELDVRWTRDLHPVIHHDASLLRLYGIPRLLSRMTLKEVKQDFPMIPTLEEVLVRYGGKLHLMIEIKQNSCPQPERQKAILRGLLASLEPMEDFHILALNPELFTQVDFLPRKAWVAVGTTQLKKISDFALKENIGGIAGHYLLLRDSMLERHHRAGSRVGTGYVGSRKCLYRELNRGVDWIFSNNGVQVQAYC